MKIYLYWIYTSHWLFLWAHKYQHMNNFQIATMVKTYVMFQSFSIYDLLPTVLLRNIKNDMSSNLLGKMNTFSECIKSSPRLSYPDKIFPSYLLWFAATRCRTAALTKMAWSALLWVLCRQRPFLTWGRQMGTGSEVQCCST